MQTTTAKKSISSAALIRLINDCRQRQANSSGVSFPSQTFPCVDHAEIAKKAQELLGVIPKASSHLFSQRQAHSISSIYGPAVQAALVDFFEEQALVVPQVEPAVAMKKQATPVTSTKLQTAMTAMGTAVEPVTMTSLEMVDYINSSREAGKAQIRHDNFMAKVPKVLGEAAPKFLGTGLYTNGTGAQVERSIYIFPKREACLMAMSYSYELQAKVFDRMTELEAQQAQRTAPHGQMPTQMSQMLSMLSEGYGKIEQELQRLNREVESLKASTSPLQRPAPKLRTKDPNRIPGPQGWQGAKTIDSLRFTFSIGPHEIGLEHFYLYLHSLDSDIARREALRQALHFGIALDASLPKHFPANPRTISFKFTMSENDASLKNVLDMLLALPDDKQRRAAIKRHLVAKSAQAVNVSVALVQQPALF